MDIEDRLRKLEIRYRAASSAAGAAKAHYRALAGEPSASLRDVERAKANWRRLDARRQEISSRMGEFEALEQDEPA